MQKSSFLNYTLSLVTPVDNRSNFKESHAVYRIHGAIVIKILKKLVYNGIQDLLRSNNAMRINTSDTFW